jgi:mandelate racemase
MTRQPKLTALKSRIVIAPLRRPLLNASGSLPSVPLLLLNLETDQGIVGIAYLFSPSPLVLKPLAALLAELGDLLQGHDVVPLDIERFLARTFLLLGGTGLVTMARAAIDMASWDVAGKAAGMPLARLWGGSPKPLLAYNSNGLGLIGADRAAKEAVELLEFGFSTVKLRLGYSTIAEDVEVTRVVQAAIGAGKELLVDYNQFFDLPEAMRRCHALDEENLLWIEEPIRADHYAGNAALAHALTTPIQIGENFWCVEDVGKALDAGACDLIMPDVMKMGGATPWLRAAALASAVGMPVSSHLFPEISQHLLSVTPTAHYLEFVDWAAPVVKDPIEIENGRTIVSERPGHGMEWNEAAIAKLLA